MSDADGALNSVKEAFQGKRGKILLVGGGIAIAAYVWWTRRNGTPEPVPGTDTGTDTTGDAGAVGPSPQTDPTVGNQNDTAGGKRKYDNNGEWLSDATDFLSGRGVPSGSAYSALSKALGGLQVTSQESSWVSQAIGALGAPPEGMPPLNSSPPASGSTSAAVLPGPGGIRATSVSTTAVDLTWNSVAGAKGYQIFVNGKQNGNSVVYNAGAARYLKANTRYTIGVKTINSKNQVGSMTSTTVTTKK